MKNVEVNLNTKFFKRVLALAVCGFAVCATLAPASAAVQTPSDGEKVTESNGSKDDIKDTGAGGDATGDAITKDAIVTVTKDALDESDISRIDYMIKYKGGAAVKVNLNTVAEPFAEESWFKTAMENKTNLVFDRMDKFGYQIMFFGSDIKNPNLRVNLAATVGATETAALKQQLPGTNLVIQFAHHGELPGTAYVTVKAEKFAAGTKLYLYYIKDDGSLEYIEQNDITVNADGTVTFAITHCSSYVLSTVAPDKANTAAVKEGAIKDTGMVNNGIALATLAGCGAALAFVASKKRKA